MDRRSAVKGVLIVAALVAAAAVMFGIIHYLDSRPTGKVEEESADPDPKCLYLGDFEYEITHNINTYMIVGTDGAGTKPNAKKYHGPMADYILFMVIDHTAGTYGFVQIDRDTITDVSQLSSDAGAEEDDPAPVSEEQICTATWFGKDLDDGLRNLSDCVSYILGGIDVDGYYSINMDHIKKLNHAVGGVTVKIEDDFSKYDKEMVPGATVHLNDDQAELFVRSRMTIGDGTNESRMKRQRTYMEALMKQAREKMGEDQSFPVDLYAELQDIATTNIPGNRVSAIANSVYKFKDTGIRDIDGEHKTGRVEGDTKDYTQFFYDESSVEKIMIDLCGLGEGREY